MKYKNLAHNYLMDNASFDRTKANIQLLFLNCSMFCFLYAYVVLFPIHSAITMPVPIAIAITTVVVVLITKQQIEFHGNFCLFYLPIFSWSNYKTKWNWKFHSIMICLPPIVIVSISIVIISSLLLKTKWSRASLPGMSEW